MTSASANLGVQLHRILENYSQKGIFGKDDEAYKSVVYEMPQQLREFVEAHTPNPDDWSVEGSVGKGNWAETPWIGIYYNRITKKASYGFHIAFLVSKDRETVYVALANSVTNTDLSMSSVDLPQVATIHAWSKGPLPPGVLSEKRQSLGAAYEDAVVLHKAYGKTALPQAPIEDDLRSLLKIYQDIAKAKLGPDMEKNYWLLGAVWQEQDMSEKFIVESRWENGYKPSDEDSSTERVRQVKSGDYVAIKSSFSQGGMGVLRIKAVGVVKKNHGDGMHLDIDWFFKGPAFDIRGTSYRTTIDKLRRPDLQKVIFHGDFKNTTLEKPVPSLPSEDLDLPKNLILYGPPGVGKTFYISQLRKKFESITEKPSVLSAWIENLSWWEVAAVALHDLKGSANVSQLMNHEYVLIKKAQSNNNNVRATLWAQMQMHTDPRDPQVKTASRSEPYLFSKNKDSVWSLTGDADIYLSELFTQKAESSDPRAPIKRYEFVTFHQSLSYEDFVEGIRPVLKEGGGVSYELHKGVFKRICEKAAADPANDYAIFIDEINRGNISKIFGELITLIEEDKRLTGKPEDLLVTLPYSKSDFGVPANLYIIGTMNSADRSIAIMDVALRRRFEFKELRPLLERVPESVDGIQLRKLLGQINKIISQKISADFEIGHAYFEKDKCSSRAELMRIWNHQILPLMKEYFWDSPEQLKAVAGSFVLEDDEENGRSFSPRLMFINDEDEFLDAMMDLQKSLGIA